jgi:hypothetical protein
MKVTRRLTSVNKGYQDWCLLWPEIKMALQNNVELEVEVRKPKRTTPQNRRMWAMLGEVARQVDWYGQKLTDEDWKHVFTAALKKQRTVPGIDGGFVVLGTSTSEMPVDDLSELMELIDAFGAQKGVIFTGETASAGA